MNRIFRCVWRCSTCSNRVVFIDNLVAKIVILRELCKYLNRAIARVRVLRAADAHPFRGGKGGDVRKS